ncbi:MAG: hypothetical protein CME62_03975 [Halobacteriovoraceae bacterium]|nr:hypothetical protein [Halobacteriovoraceae bacterium]|tara:strand:- start:17818 stop:19575 length:1758 start_codon:yes stop_codon:yes gene_type:complete
MTHKQSALFLSFLCGFFSMAIEILLIRTVNFYMGSSIYGTSTILTAFFLAMAFGQLFSPQIHERLSSKKWNYIIICCINLMIIFHFALATKEIVSFLFQIMGERLYSPFFLVLMGSLYILPYVPAIAISSAVIPTLIIENNEQRVSAKEILCFSTAGCILGTIFITFIGFPYIGVKISLILLLILFCFIITKWYEKRFFYFVFLTLPIFLVSLFVQNNLKTSLYSINFSQKYSLDDEKVISYTDTIIGANSVIFLNSPLKNLFSLINAGPILTHPSDKLLILGSAAGGLTEQILTLYPKLKVDLVEIDPYWIKTLKKRNPQIFSRVNFIESDLVLYTKTTKKRYDYIIFDAFSNGNIPTNLLHKSVFDHIYNILTPKGILSLNNHMLDPYLESPEIEKQLSSRTLNNTLHASGFQSVYKHLYWGHFFAFKSKKDLTNYYDEILASAQATPLATKRASLLFYALGLYDYTRFHQSTPIFKDDYEYHNDRRDLQLDESFLSQLQKDFISTQKNFSKRLCQLTSNEILKIIPIFKYQINGEVILQNSQEVSNCLIFTYYSLYHHIMKGRYNSAIKDLNNIFSASELKT